jgi:nucleoside-diphosphate-sugar epimerase
MKIVVSGSTSGIGRYMVKELARVGYEVIELGGRDSNSWKLGEPFPLKISADILLHLAHDRQLTVKQNIEAAEKLVSTFTGYKILLSSLSAHENSKSVYGRSKYAIEEIFLRNNGSALRAGIVFGQDVLGIYTVLTKILKKIKFIILPFAGNPRFFMTDVRDLAKEIQETIKYRPNDVVFAAHYWPKSMKELLIRISEIENINISKKIIRIPAFLTNGTILILRPLAKKFSFIDSLTSLQKGISNTEIVSLRQPISNFRDI